MKKQKTQKVTKYLEERGIELRPWQEQALIGFLTHVEKNQEPASGKTFVAKILSDFIHTQGEGDNRFKLDIPYREHKK